MKSAQRNQNAGIFYRNFFLGWGFNKNVMFTHSEFFFLQLRVSRNDERI